MFLFKCLCLPLVIYRHALNCSMFRDSASVHFHCPVQTGFLMQDFFYFFFLSKPKQAQRKIIYSPTLFLELGFMGRSLCQSGIGPGTKLPSDPCLAAVLFWLHTHRTWVHTFIQKPCTSAGIFCSLCTDIITAVAHLKRTARAYKHSEVPDPFFFSSLSLSSLRASWKEKGVV